MKPFYITPECTVFGISAAQCVLQSSPLLLYGILGAAGAEQEYNTYDSDF